MSDPDPITFTFAQLARLQAMRDQNATSLEGFIDELVQATPQAWTPQVSLGAPEHGPATGPKASRWAHLKRHIRQARQAWRATRGAKTLLIYGVEPNRLDLRVSDDLGTLVQAHLAPDLASTQGWFDDPTTQTLGFDPKTALSHDGLSSQVTTPCLSPLAVMWIGLTRVWCTNPLNLIRAFRMALKTLGPAYPSLARRVVSLAVLCLFLNGLRHLLHPVPQVRFLTLTSNSVFLEALRSMVLAQKGGDVVEIQHGVASPIFDPYLSGFGPAIDTIDRGHFTLHPLLGPPFCLPPEQAPRFHFTDQPSNTGIFKALHRLGPDGTPPLPNLARQKATVLERIWQHAAPYCQADRPVFAILGGTDLGDNFYTGRAFGVEMHLVQAARQRFVAAGQDVQFLYLPHPANPPLAALHFEDGEQIEISSRSQISYFFADYALSLYSSSIFEAAYFGAQAFAPLPAGMGFFHADMLRQLHIPDQVTAIGLNQALDRFCATPAPGAADHRAKIAQRLDRVFTDAVSPFQEEHP